MPSDIVVLISATAEWRAVREFYPHLTPEPTPYGETFSVPFAGRDHPVPFLHGGWGKIAAAASAQYAIKRWSPSLVVNLGTCGGFEGAVERDAVILAERTLVYDIIEQMDDQQAALDHYTTDLNPAAWLREPYPLPVIRGLLISGDRDLVPSEIPTLQATFGASFGDWESGAIAWVAARNHVRCLILRGVTDLVGPSGGEAYDGSITFFSARARVVMQRLLASLPAWLDAVVW